MAQPPPQVKIVDVDLPDVLETFADSIKNIGFDHGVWRFEFSVTRLGEPQPPVIPAKRYPVCRLVMPMNAGLALHDQLRNLVELMAKQGMVKIQQTPDITIPPGTKPN